MSIPPEVEKATELTAKFGWASNAEDMIKAIRALGEAVQALAEAAE